MGGERLTSGSRVRVAREAAPAATARRPVSLTARTMLAALLLAGCASSFGPAPTPITDMRQIEGKWQGTITLGFNGPQQLYYITINPDGTFTAQWGINWQWGRVTLSGGPLANFQLNDTGTGTVRYYGGPKRSLTLEGTFGNWSAYVTPVT